MAKIAVTAAYFGLKNSVGTHFKILFLTGKFTVNKIIKIITFLNENTNSFLKKF